MIKCVQDMKQEAHGPLFSPKQQFLYLLELFKYENLINYCKISQNSHIFIHKTIYKKMITDIYFWTTYPKI